MAGELTIITNNVPRDVLDGWDIPADVRADFDYIDWDAVERGEASASFVQYRGVWYDLDDTEGSWTTLPADHPLRAWSTYVSDSYFSGVVFRWVGEECDQVVCGRYYS